MTSVLIADDQELVRTGFRLILELAGLDVAGEAADGAQALELEVLRMIGRGLSNGEIAEALVISPATVKTHVRHVLAKLSLRDRVQAVVLAYESGLVSASAHSRP